VAKLITQNGADMRLPDLREILAGDCPRARSSAVVDRCGVHYPQPARVVLSGGLFLGTLPETSLGCDVVLPSACSCPLTLMGCALIIK
jgi:hypothetical protein